MKPGSTQPMKCPKCPEKHYFGILKTPNDRVGPCPNCSTVLIPVRPTG